MGWSTHALISQPMHVRYIQNCVHVSFLFAEFLTCTIALHNRDSKRTLHSTYTHILLVCGNEKRTIVNYRSSKIKECCFNAFLMWRRTCGTTHSEASLFGWKEIQSAENHCCEHTKFNVLKLRSLNHNLLTKFGCKQEIYLQQCGTRTRRAMEH